MRVARSCRESVFTFKVGPPFSIVGIVTSTVIYISLVSSGVYKAELN